MFDAHATGTYFATGTWKNTTWKGVPIFKFPTDMVAYHERIYEYKPDVIVELGSAAGGSALYFADQMVAAGKPPNVLSIDPLAVPVAPPIAALQGVRFIKGSSLDPVVVEQVKDFTTGRRVLISLDSDHIYGQVREELALYGPMIQNGLLVVEDTFLGHVDPDLIPDRYAMGNDPAAALRDFLANEGAAFAVLPDLYSITMNPGGWLHV